MIIVKLKVNRSLTADHWKGMAMGVPDEYGNPFRIIKLRWNLSRLHKMTDYVKTRGCEDAIIGQNRATGDIKITYRQQGSIMWQRPAGGVGLFVGEIAYTPKNMTLLARSYGDRLWTIIDQDINEQVKILYQKIVDGMTPQEVELNVKRVSGTHRMAMDGENTAIKGVEPSMEGEKMTMIEQRRLNQIEKQDLDKRRIALEEKEKGINQRFGEAIADGAMPVVYQEEYLNKQKLLDLRKISTQMKVTWAEKDHKEDLVKRIIEKQNGNAEAVAVAMAASSDGLDV